MKRYMLRSSHKSLFYNPICIINNKYKKCINGLVTIMKTLFGWGVRFGK